MFDQSIILYFVSSGTVYGGSNSHGGRKVKQVERDSDGYYPGGDITMELDLSNRSLVMVIDDERTILDANLGDFQYSPFVRQNAFAPEITLLWIIFPVIVESQESMIILFYKCITINVWNKWLSNKIYCINIKI